MSRICSICGKGPVAGRSITRRGLAKKKGGIGRNVTGIAIRRFLPNIQTVKANVNGSIRKIKVCVRCIRSDRVQKA